MSRMQYTCSVAMGPVDQLVEIVLMYEQVGVIGFWTGSDTSATVQPDIPTWFESVTMVPVPDCTCPE